MKRCLNCQKEFEAKKPKAKFCSANCRVVFNRKLKQAEKFQETMRQELAQIDFLKLVGRQRELFNELQASLNGKTECVPNNDDLIKVTVKEGSVAAKIIEAVNANKEAFKHVVQSGKASDYNRPNAKEEKKEDQSIKSEKSSYNPFNNKRFQDKNKS